MENWDWGRHSDLHRATIPGVELLMDAARIQPILLCQKPTFFCFLITAKTSWGQHTSSSTFLSFYNSPIEEPSVIGFIYNCPASYMQPTRWTSSLHQRPLSARRQDCCCKISQRISFLCHKYWGKPSEPCKMTSIFPHTYRCNITHSFTFLPLTNQTVSYYQWYIS